MMIGLDTEVTMRLHSELVVRSYITNTLKHLTFSCMKRFINFDRTDP